MKLIPLLLMAGACNTGKPDTTRQDTLRVQLNESFKIELGTSMGTGYSWRISDSSYLGSLSLDSTQVLNNVQGKDDGPDIQIFFFTARKKGETKLHFIRTRPWKKKDPPDKERTYTLLIE